MNLLQMAMVKAVRLKSSIKKDTENRIGTVKWVADGKSFDCAIVPDESRQVTIAMAKEAEESYFIYLPIEVKLNYHDVIKRQSDGSTFRIVSNGDTRIPPVISSIKAKQLRAERWDLPYKGAD